MDKEKEKAKISYFSLSGLQGKEAKLDWIAGVSFKEIEFDNIQPDGKENWINQTDNDFDSFLALVDKEVKAGRSEEAVFKLFSLGVKTQRDEWVYDFSRDCLIEKAKYLVDAYMEQLKQGTTRELDVKWDAETTQYIKRKISKSFEESQVIRSLYRPYVKEYLYFDRHFNGRTYQMFNIFPQADSENKLICVTNHVQIPFLVEATSYIPSLDVGGRPGQCLPLYRYDANGDRIENITDWALEKFREHYSNQPSHSTRGLSPLLPSGDSSEVSFTDSSLEEARGLS